MKARYKAAAALLFLLTTAGLSLWIPFPKSRLKHSPYVSLQIRDRNNLLMREVLSREGGRCTWVKIEDVSPSVITATLAAEDKNFFLHPGIDLFALGRAVVQNIRRRKVVSGASTITQQAVRNIFHHKRTFGNKILEAWLAVRLERTASKEEILSQYLNRISYGNQAFGIEAASRLYFDKKSSDLSLAESAFLAALPRSPSVLNPYRSIKEASARQKEILNRVYRLHFIDRSELKRALAEPIHVIPENIKFRAPHFCDLLLQRRPQAEGKTPVVLHTTLDYPLQAKIEKLAARHIASLSRKNITNVSVVVMENLTGDILAMLGSKDFFDDRIDGQFNGAVALRQPGSTLKPFTYGLALESGMTAASVLSDREVQYQTPTGNYSPQNYDKTFHGPVRMRKALACSFNVPAVTVLEKIGTDRLYRKLHECGFVSLKKGPGYYGIGLTLGNGEVTLLELAQAYAALARGGVFFPAGFLLSPSRIPGQAPQAAPSFKMKRVFSPQTAYILTDILSDADARVPAFGYNCPLDLPFPCAAKTGTSKDFRDNWTVGYTTRYTVGVWVGNFDAQPMHNVSGITGCGPLFRDVMLLLHKKHPPKAFPMPEKLVRVAVCPVSGERATSSCPGIMEEIFTEGTAPQETCQIHGRESLSGFTEAQARRQKTAHRPLSVIFPIAGDTFKIDPVLRREYQVIRFQARVSPGMGIQKIEWLLNGRTAGTSGSPFRFSWKLNPGSYTLKIRAHAEGQTIESKAVVFRVLR